jgi:hypothetical protein
VWSGKWNSKTVALVAAVSLCSSHPLVLFAVTRPAKRNAAGDLGIDRSSSAVDELMHATAIAVAIGVMENNLWGLLPPLPIPPNDCRLPQCAQTSRV